MKVFQKKKYIKKAEHRTSKSGEAEFSRPSKIEIFNSQTKV